MYKVNPCVDDFKLDQNRSCSICNKVVVNLTNKSDEEVLKLYQISNGNLCGAAKSSYFNTSYYLHPFKRFAFSVLLVFGSSLFVLDAFAQDSIQAMQQGVNLDTVVNESTLVIKGKVIDEKGEVLPFTRVYFEENEMVHGAVTDWDGFYQIKVDNYKWESDTLRVNCRAIEYENQENIIIKSNLDFYTVNFKLEESDWESLHIVVGGIRMGHFSLDSDAHRSTTIKSKEIRRLPIKR